MQTHVLPAQPPNNLPRSSSHFNGQAWVHFPHPSHLGCTTSAQATQSFTATATSDSKDQRQGHESCLRFQRPGFRCWGKGFPPTAIPWLLHGGWWWRGDGAEWNIRRYSTEVGGEEKELVIPSRREGGKKMCGERGSYSWCQPVVTSASRKSKSNSRDRRRQGRPSALSLSRPSHKGQWASSAAFPLPRLWPVTNELRVPSKCTYQSPAPLAFLPLFRVLALLRQSVSREVKWSETLCSLNLVSQTLLSLGVKYNMCMHI